MSGQTYTTIIRIPTPQELAALVADAARGQGVSGAEGFEGSQAFTALTRLRASALRFVVDMMAPVATPITGTVSARGATTAEVEVAVGAARVPVRVDVDPADPEAGRLTLSFANAHGLSCIDEARVAAQIAALFARACVVAPDPSPAPAAASRPGTATGESRR